MKKKYLLSVLFLLSSSGLMAETSKSEEDVSTKTTSDVLDSILMKKKTELSSDNTSDVKDLDDALEKENKEDKNKTPKEQKPLTEKELVASEAEKAVIAKRIMDRRKVVDEGDYFSAYEYLAPAQKQIIQRKFYSQFFGTAIEYESYDIKSYQCDKDNIAKASKCKVDIYVTFLRGGVKRTYGNMINETWIKVDNTWYFYQTK